MADGRDHKRLRGVSLAKWICATVRNRRNSITSSTFNIWVYGDSNSFRPGGGKKSWPGLLQQKCPSLLNIVNQSRDGRTVGQDTGALNGLHDFKRRLSDHPGAGLIVIMLGTNDLKREYGPPEPEAIARDLDVLIDTARTKDNAPTIFLLSVPPMGKLTQGHLAGADAMARRLAAEYRELAARRDVHFIDVHSLLDARTDLEADKIHLNAAGRNKIANAVWERVKIEFPQHRGMS
jgi:lysophospholipase L1-like esterase